jgi:predicted NAD-dependent protein-ADP-ribosyltransferase YbiA (DUF1768 family)
MFGAGPMFGAGLLTPPKRPTEGLLFAASIPSANPEFKIRFQTRKTEVGKVAGVDQREPAEIDDATKVRKTNSPMQAARLGRDRKQKLRRDWESVKVDIMRQAVMAKFTQHEELRALLLSTGVATIVEHTDNDDYWGDGTC